MRRIERVRAFNVRTLLAALVSATAFVWATPLAPAPASAVVPTIVTIEWHDGNADQVGALPILESHSMHATFLVNTGPILAGDAGKLTIADLQSFFAVGNEIAGHALDHVNVQPLSTADARYEVCTDRNNLLDMGFQPQSLAYPFASFDSGSEDVAHFCNYNDASATAGLTLKGPVANTVPPGDPYAIRTVNAVKKSTKLATLKRYVLAAEASAQANGSAWTIFVFHHLCDAHCGPYVVSAAKFGAFLDFLYTEEANGVVVETMADVVGGVVKGRCDPVTATGCDTTPR